MSTITGRISNKHNPFLEVQHLPMPGNDAQKRDVSRIRDAFRRPKTALAETDLSGIEHHILDTTKDAYRL